ncbi:hypothetical protein THAOC_14103 [Thalassiosira oceanica]|uniref:Uncharacterized protein n=1 Tax=Thalassiosira oceanica TaxID=159749 RepID=K0SI89_THAOC|nr:hypothetical protein THAOC_14103 [Thalassiosira oceanica]|eukprot:EJK65090.1 hypothetical protein THAOC_14103 [Thalassiosira oceanica]
MTSGQAGGASRGRSVRASKSTAPPRMACQDDSVANIMLSEAHYRRQLPRAEAFRLEMNDIAADTAESHNLSPTWWMKSAVAKPIVSSSQALARYPLQAYEGRFRHYTRTNKYNAESGGRGVYRRAMVVVVPAIKLKAGLI